MIRSLRARLAGRQLMKAGLVTMALSAATLVINLGTGVLLARELDPNGRGEVTATLVVVQFLGWLASIGARSGIAFRIARDPQSTARVLGTWMAILPLMALLSAAIAEALLATLFAAQTDASLHTARLFVLVSGLIGWTEIMNGILLGHERYSIWNVVRFLQPLVLLVAYVVMWMTGTFTVGLALVFNGISIATVPGVSLIFAVVTWGIGRPSLAIARSTVFFGLRSHLGTLSSLLNTRLDLLIMPAILSASSIGLYAVSTNVASVVFTITGTLNYLTLPAAVRRGDRGPQTILLSAFGALLIGATLALALLIVGPFAIPAVYGSDFSGAVTPLLLLLPGAVLFAPATILIAGMDSLNRPGLGSLPPIAAAVITVAGLALFLRRGGPDAAAIVSSCSYAATFLGALLLFRRTASISWGDLLRVRRELLRQLLPSSPS
jgi:O-antigen/teichoic acid export membrane protein